MSNIALQVIDQFDMIIRAGRRVVTALPALTTHLPVLEVRLMADSQLSTTPVIYKFIPGFPEYYRVGNNGTVWTRIVKGSASRRIGPWRLMKPFLVSQGNYLSINLFRDGKRHPRSVHRLVLEIFIGPCPPGMEACHKDGDGTNNQLGNLKWDLHINNCFDRDRNGFNRGETHPSSKLTESMVRTIKEACAGGASHAEVARRFAVCTATVGMIVSGKTWKHVL